MGICGQVQKESPERIKEKNDLKKKKNILKSNINALKKQFDFMKNISIEIIENKPQNNINNIIQNNNFDKTFKFQDTGGNLINLPVNDKTTVGEVITNLYNKFGISLDKQLYFLYDATRFDYKTSDTTLFKNLSFNPNNAILVMQQ